MELHAVDFAGPQFHARRYGHAPVLAAEAHPARRRPAANQNGIQYSEGNGRKVDEALPSGHADGLTAKCGNERRVSVDDDVTRSQAHSGGMSNRGTAAGGGDLSPSIWLIHAVDCALLLQARTTAGLDAPLWKARRERTVQALEEGEPAQSALDQACSWTTASLSMAKTQRPWPRSSNSMRSGSIYS